MRRSIPILLVTGTATALALSGCNSPSRSAAPGVATATQPVATAGRPEATAAAPPARLLGPAVPAGATARTIQGPSEDMQWGPVQVTIIVKGKRITDVQATTPTERARSAYINGIAVPMLRQEVLKAQSANVYGISGATMTSEAFYMSLQNALRQAHK